MNAPKRYELICDPQFYEPRNGLPLHWTMIERLVLDLSGERAPLMKDVVTRYMRHRAQPSIELSRLDFETIKAYLMHWVWAPIWDAAECGELADELRVSLDCVATMSELDQWLEEAGEHYGFDAFSPPTDEEIAEIRRQVLGSGGGK